MTALFVTLLALAAPQAHGQTSICDVIDGRWNTQPSLHREIQAFSPTTSGRTSASRILDRSIAGLKELVQLYHPSVWPYLSVTYAVDPASTTYRPVANMNLAFSFGPWGFQGTVPIQFSQCPADAAAGELPGHRVQFDLRRATGDLAGVVSAMRINFSVVERDNSPGYINVSSTVGILPGRNYANHGSEIEDYLRKQIWPFMDALREQYANTRQMAEIAERSARADYRP
jgi:hypothetical protein